MDIRAASHEKQGGYPLIITNRTKRPLNDHTAPVVATHDINGYAHSDDQALETPARALWSSAPGCHADDLSAFIKPARGADPMWDVGSIALRAPAQLREGHDTVVSAAHALPAPGRFSFRNTHKKIV